MLLQPAVHSENRKGFTSVPWGAPVFVQITDDSAPFSHTCLHSSIPKMTDDDDFILNRFWTRKCGCIVLKALELTEGTSDSSEFTVLGLWFLCLHHPNVRPCTVQASLSAATVHNHLHTRQVINGRTQPETGRRASWDLRKHSRCQHT